MNLPDGVRLGEGPQAALEAGRPVVALESAVATHGLPYPISMSALTAMERAVKEAGAVPATCLLHRGQLLVGAALEQVEEVTTQPSREKASVRDLGWGVACGISAGLTVSASLFVANLAGINVFATGGIGGVHIGAKRDVSADLYQLARSPLVTVCSGAKSVLDIPATLELLETLGVPVYSYRTSEFPAFYLRSSGVPSRSLDSAEMIGRVARHHWALGLSSGIVIGNPISVEAAVKQPEWDGWLNRALEGMKTDKVSGKAVTPYLLDKVAEYSKGQTVESNVALLESNARLAGEVAVTLAS